MASMVGKLRHARSAVLSVAGFGSLTASAWTALGTWAGLGALGVSCLLLEYLTGDEEARR